MMTDIKVLTLAGIAPRLAKSPFGTGTDLTLTVG